MREARILIVLMVCFVLIPFGSAHAASGCGGSELASIPSGCRVFQSSEPDSNGIFTLFMFESAIFPSVQEADRYFTAARNAEEPSATVVTSTTYVFGDRQAVFRVTLSSATLVLFEIRQQVASWFVLEGNADQASHLKILHDLLLKMQTMTFNDDASGHVMSLLPSLDDLPSGLSMMGV